MSDNVDYADLRILSEGMPAMTRLFEYLDSGITPDFLTMMSALSEMTAYFSDHDACCKLDKPNHPWI